MTASQKRNPYRAAYRAAAARAMAAERRRWWRRFIGGVIAGVAGAAVLAGLML